MLPYQNLGKVLILLGLFLILIGGLVYLAPRLPFLQKIPGNLSWQKGSVRVYFPLGTCILVSILLTLLFHFLGRK